MKRLGAILRRLADCVDPLSYPHENTPQVRRAAARTRVAVDRKRGVVTPDWIVALADEKDDVRGRVHKAIDVGGAPIEGADAYVEFEREAIPRGHWSIWKN